MDKLQVRYGRVWADEHGGNGGYEISKCKFGSPITKVSLRISNIYGGFVEGIKFVQDLGNPCIIGHMKSLGGRTVNLEPKNSYLSYISGGLDVYGSSLCVNGIKLHWKKLHNFE